MLAHSMPKLVIHCKSCGCDFFSKGLLNIL